MLGVLLSAFFFHSLLEFPCLSAGEGSFTVTYNGGKIMTKPVTVTLLWFGDEWSESGRETLRNAIASLTPKDYAVENSEVPTLRNWWEIIKQYKDGSNTHVTDSVNLGAECFYTGPQLNITLEDVVRISISAFNQTSLGMLNRKLSCTQVFDANDKTIYYVLFSETVTFLQAEEQLEFINSCSGDLKDLEVSGGVKVKMVWARAPMDDLDQCSWNFDRDTYVGPPNGDEKIDCLVGNVLGKIAEEVTNRDGKGWSTNRSDEVSGLSISGVCALLERQDYAPPFFRDLVRNVSFNIVGVNGYRYIVQHIWNQQSRNCALKLSGTCGVDAVTLTHPKGYVSAGVTVNHTAGLQPYPPNQKCLWNIQYPSAKFISFNLNYISITKDDDHLSVCESESTSCSSIQLSSNDTNKQFKVTGARAYIEFTSGDHASTQSTGWELTYAAGLCNGKEDVYEHSGVINYTSPTGYSYVDGIRCQWILHGKQGTLVSLSFTHINTSKDLDFIAIYSTTNQIASQVGNFSGLFSESNLPKFNLTGEVMIIFSTQTDQGTGWSANFYISSPIKYHKSPLLNAIIVSTAILVGCSLVFVALAFIRKKRNLRSRRNSNDKVKLIRIKVNREEHSIGEGPSATVYRTILRNGSAVAVKSQRDKKGKTDLEEEILLKVSTHPNIISLLGYAQCQTRRRLLVFEFMNRGSLSWNLRERGEGLSWDKRLCMALHVSSALQFLHMYSKPQIYHGNLTSENVLLDDSWNAKLGGFGSANFCETDELNLRNRTAMAVDVWNFGLLLVELLTGEPLRNRFSPESSDYLDKVNDLLGNQKHLDPRLELPQEDQKLMGLAKLGEIAKWCIISKSDGEDENSPKIGDIVLGLKQVEQLFRSVTN